MASAFIVVGQVINIKEQSSLKIKNLDEFHRGFCFSFYYLLDKTSFS